MFSRAIIQKKQTEKKSKSWKEAKEPFFCIRLFWRFSFFWDEETNLYGKWDENPDAVNAQNKERRIMSFRRKDSLPYDKYFLRKAHNS